MGDTDGDYLGKGGNQQKAPFTRRTAELLREWLRVKRVSKVNENMYISNILGMRRRGVQIMLYRLERKTGLQCKLHTYRRTFAGNLPEADSVQNYGNGLLIAHSGTRALSWVFIPSGVKSRVRN